jgi:hypothetical protein
MRLQSKIERYARIAQNVSIIIGVLGGALSLIIVQFDKRVERTLDLYRDYTNVVRKDFLDLDLKWAQFASPDPGILDKTPEEQKKTVYAFFDTIENQRLLANVLNFYDTLYVCVVNRACDRNSAIDLFGSTAKITFEISAHYIDVKRKTQRNDILGRGLEQMYRIRRESFFERYR